MSLNGTSCKPFRNYLEITVCDVRESKVEVLTLLYQSADSWTSQMSSDAGLELLHSL